MVGRALPYEKIAFSVLSAVALGHALQLNNGVYSDEALIWLGVGLGLGMMALLLPEKLYLNRSGEMLCRSLIAAGMFWQLCSLLSTSPGFYLRPLDPSVFIFGVVAAAMLSGSVLSNSATGSSGLQVWIGRFRFPILLAVFVMVGVWLIQASPAPVIDVDRFQRIGLDALLKGQNPYRAIYPNIYLNNDFYGEGMSVNGRLTFGFPYPPLSLLLALPGHLLGDYRYAQLAALVLSGALIAYARPHPLSEALVVLFFFTPRVFFVLEQGWTEPFVLLTFSAFIFSLLRYPRTAPWIFGLALASKQYVFLMVPLLPLIWNAKAAGIVLAKAMVIAVLVTIPLALWSLPNFFSSVVTLHFKQPFRLDALSLLAWLAREGFKPSPTLCGFGALTTIIIVAHLRRLKGAGNFTLASAMAFFGFFVCNKQAFCNYYFLVIGLLCISAAIATEVGREKTGKVSA